MRFRMIVNAKICVICHSLYTVKCLFWLPGHILIFLSGEGSGYWREEAGIGVGGGGGAGGGERCLGYLVELSSGIM